MKNFFLQLCLFLAWLSISSCINNTSGTPNPPPVQQLPTQPTYTPTITLTPTETPVLLGPFIAEGRQPDICYNGPGEDYPSVASIVTGFQVDVLGKNSDGGEWFRISRAGFAGSCWIKATDLNFTFDINSLPSISTALVIENSACRHGPGVVYKKQLYIPKGWRIIINGKNNVEADWVLVTPLDPSEQCWIARSLLSFNDIFAVPTVDTPEPPSITQNTPASSGGGGDGGGDGGGGGSTNPDPTDSPDPTEPPPPPICLNPKGHPIPCH